VLGEGAEFTAICELPEEISIQKLETELRSLAELAGGEITVSPFQLGSVHSSSGRIMHRVEFTGGDQPGLIERLSVSIPEERVSSCLTAVDNTAGILGVKCRWWGAI
jgi:glycine cleavage system transcriptional repressor